MPRKPVHPVTASVLYANERIRLCEVISSRELLKQLKIAHDKVGIDLHQDDIISSFGWAQSPQGHDYWANLHYDGVDTYNERK